MITIIKEEKYRSHSRVDIPDDSIRVTLDMSLKEWWPIQRAIKDKKDLLQSSAEKEIRETLIKLDAEAEELKQSGELGLWWDQKYKLTGLRVAVEIFDKHTIK